MGTDDETPPVPHSASCKLPGGHYLLSAALCRLYPACCPLLAASFLLRTASYRGITSLISAVAF